MTQGMRLPEIDPGALSADGNFYWDGVRWTPSLSPDGHWRWTGAAWVRSQPGLEPAQPYLSPRELGVWVSVLLGISAALAVVEALFGADSRR